MRPENIIAQFADTDGDGGGTINAIGNYSGTADDFYIEAQAGERIGIARVIVQIEDSGAFDAGTYGNGVALTNGITVLVLDSENSTIIDLTGGEPIKKNSDWGRLCYDVQVLDWGTGNEFCLARWTFSRMSDQGDPLILSEGQKLVFRLNDDFSGLVGHRFFIEGEHQPKE